MISIILGIFTGEKLLVFKFDKDKLTNLSSEIFNVVDKLNELSLLSKEDSTSSNPIGFCSSVSLCGNRRGGSVG